MLRRSLATALAVLLAAGALAQAPPAAAASAPFQYYPGTPQGNIGASRPTVADGIVLAPGVPTSQVSFHMTLNGTTVPARIATDGSRIWYQPPAPLPAGAYAVALHIAVGSWYADVDWNFVVLPTAVASLPAMSPADALALAWLNTYRSLAGLPPLEFSPALGAAASAHAQFYVQNETRYGSQITLSVHQENASWPGFTGVGPANRASYFGFGYGSVGEDMSFGSGVTGAVDGWMDSVYHRFAITDSLARFAGFSIAGDAGGDGGNLPVTDLEVGEAGNGPADPSQAIVYPAPGQTGVVPAFPAGEVPDPLSAFTGSSYPAGYPITLEFASPQAQSVAVTSASLSGPNGTPVPFDLLDAATPLPSSAATAAVSEMGPDVALIPKQPLLPNTTYQVTVDGTVTDLDGAMHPFGRTWSFSTSPYVDPGNLSADPAGGAKVVLTSSGATGQARIFIGGLPVQDARHTGSNTITFSIPPGLPATADLYIVQPDGQEESWPAFVGSGAGFASPAGPGPVTPVAGGVRVGSTLLVPLAGLGPQVRASTIASNGMTVLQSGGGRVLGAFRVDDPVGYVRAGGGHLQRVVFTNPPITVSRAVYIPLPLARAAGYNGAAAAVSYAPRGYVGGQLVTLTVGSGRYTSDGKAGAWPAGLGSPFVNAAGRTMVPLRALAYLFGLNAQEITWFGPGGTPGTGPVQEVDLTTPWGATIKVLPGRVTRTPPGGGNPVAIPLDTSGLTILAGRTYLPFRAIGYAFGLDANQIGWTSNPSTGATTTVYFNWDAAP